MESDDDDVATVI